MCGSLRVAWVLISGPCLSLVLRLREPLGSAGLRVVLQRPLVAGQGIEVSVLVVSALRSAPGREPPHCTARLRYPVRTGAALACVALGLLGHVPGCFVLRRAEMFRPRELWGNLSVLGTWEELWESSGGLSAVEWLSLGPLCEVGL